MGSGMKLELLIDGAIFLILSVLMFLFKSSFEVEFWVGYGLLIIGLLLHILPMLRDAGIDDVWMIGKRTVMAIFLIAMILLSLAEMCFSLPVKIGVVLALLFICVYGICLYAVAAYGKRD